MGQTSSYSQKQCPDDWIFKSETELRLFFRNRTLKQFTTKEIILFRRRIPKDIKITSVIELESLKTLFCLPNNDNLIIDIFLRFFQTLGSFPLINSGVGEITYLGILQSCILMCKKRCIEFVEIENYEYTKLLFISLSQKTNENNIIDITYDNNDIDAKKIIQNFHNINIDDIFVSGDVMLRFITFLLILAKHCTMDKKWLYPNMYKHWTEYRHHAINILRSMDSSIITSYDLSKSMIRFEEFNDVIMTVSPNLLNSLDFLVEHLTIELDHKSQAPQNIPMTILSSDSLIAQLSTIIPDNLILAGLHKLYIARESGFSIRSFERNVAKWMAPSIMFISGIRISDDYEYISKNPRYKRFFEEYPRFNNEAQQDEAWYSKKCKLIFAVYVSESWKISNKTLFGDLNTQIIQLAPKQEIFKAHAYGNIFLNTVGGGIGIGSSQPIIKSNNKRYLPGNVSLNIDDTLEFATFRHVGYGGLFSPGSLLLKKGKEKTLFEYRMIIQDLEVWGCGSEKEIKEQVYQWEWEEAEAKRRQNVNLQSIGEDRAILEMAGLIGQYQNGGSV